jgi:hypothetical protein
MIHLAAELETNLDGMETLSIGRSAVAGEDCTLEICGTWLCYRIVLREGDVHVSANLMDDASPPDLLLRARDTASDCEVVRRLISSMERNGVKSLERPIESGYGDGPENWIIW